MSQQLVQPVPATPPGNHRFHLLDAARGLAALFIVAWHLPLAMRNRMPDASGFLAVDFFFCLSGFVIAFSYEKRLAEGLSLQNFSVARAIRLYPLYCLGTVLGLLQCLVLVSRSSYRMPGGLLSVPAALLMLPSWMLGSGSLNSFPFDPPAWSLFHEVLANLLFSMLVKVRLARSGLFVAIAIVSFYVLFRSAAGGGLNEGGTADTFAASLARIGFSFTAGVLLHRMFLRHRQCQLSNAFRYLLSAVVFGALTLVLWSPWRSMRLEGFHLAAIVIVFPGLVYAGCFAKLPGRLEAFGGALGEASYPLYILHGVVLVSLYGRRATDFTSRHPQVGDVVAVTLIVVLALLSFWVARKLDAPVRKALTRRYIRRKSTELAHGA